jgi:hypothetical protein
MRTRITTVAILGAALALSGCISGARHAAQDDATCQGYGAKPGSDLYVQCRMSADNNRSARMSAYAQSRMANQYQMNSMRPTKFTY